MATPPQGSEKPAAASTPPLCPGAASPVQNIVNKLFDNVFKSDREKKPPPNGSTRPEREREEKDNNEETKDQPSPLFCFSPGEFECGSDSDVVDLFSWPEEPSHSSRESSLELDPEQFAAEVKRVEEYERNQAVENCNEPKSAQKAPPESPSHQQPNSSSPRGSSAKSVPSKAQPSAPQDISSQVRTPTVSLARLESLQPHSRDKSAPSSPFEPEYEEPALVAKAMSSACRLRLGSPLPVTASATIEETQPAPLSEAANEIRKNDRSSSSNAKAVDSAQLCTPNRKSDQKESSKLFEGKKNIEPSHVMKNTGYSPNGKQVESTTPAPKKVHEEQINGVQLVETQKNQDVHDDVDKPKHTSVLNKAPFIDVDGALSTNPKLQPKETILGKLVAVTVPQAAADRKRLRGSDSKDLGLPSKQPRSGSLDVRITEREHPNKVMSNDANIIDIDGDVAKDESRKNVTTGGNHTHKDKELESKSLLNAKSGAGNTSEANGDLGLSPKTKEAGDSRAIEKNDGSMNAHAEISNAKDGQNHVFNPTSNTHSADKNVTDSNNNRKVPGESPSPPKRKLLEVSEVDANGQSKGNDEDERPAKRPKSNELRKTPPRKTKKRERTNSSSPTVLRVESNTRRGAYAKPLKSVSFSGYSEFSTLLGHQVTAVIDDQKYTGWVMDPNPSVSSIDFSKTNGNKSTPTPKKASDQLRNHDRIQAGHLDSTMEPRPHDLTPGKSDPKVLVSKVDIASAVDSNVHNHHRPVLDTNVPQRSVLIVGAGIAGIAAAQALTERGFKVTVLEGRDRIGGRIATDWSTGFPVDLGAAYIHGAYGNPLSEVAREAELRTFSPKDVDALYYLNGKRVSRKLDELAENVWKALLRRAGSIAKSGILKQQNLDLSLGKLLDRLKVIVKGGCGKELNELLGWHASNLEMACASELTGLSAKYYDMDDRAGFSGSHKLVRDGYSSIVYTLARTIDVRLGSRVVSIQRDASVEKSSKPATSEQDGMSTNQNGVDVDSTRDGETAKEEKTTKTRAVRVITDDGIEHVAESCIVTVPLGVLQNGDIRFIPQLPQRKQKAIDSIGFGVVDKIIMEFERPFWVSTKYETQGSDNGEFEGPDQIGRVSKKQGVFSFFISLWRCVGAPILVAVTSGEFAKFIEKSKDSEVLDMALAALDEMFPDRHPSKLVSHTVTRWKADQFSRGSYSYPRVGTTPQDYIEFSKPVGNLYFAGEATHQDHPATAHGAYMSGIREAARIIAGSGLSESARRKYARELFLMQNPHASLGKDGANNRKLTSAQGRGVTGNGGARGSQKSPASRTPRKRRKSRRSD